jgi:dCMP deaminase
MRPSLDEHYTAMVGLVAMRATCPRRSVGAVLVDDRGRLVSTGYNGPPSGMPHCTERPCAGAESIGGPREACDAVHAECNALLQAQASRRSPRTLYCSTTPCFYCAKMLVTAGIRRVVALTMYKHDKLGVDLLLRAGVELEVKGGRMTSREMVAEFMAHIGSDVPDRVTDRAPAVAALREQLILEELLETHRAMAAGDAAEALDGLADLKYVVVGCAVAYGLPMEDFFYAPSPAMDAPDAAAAASLMLACTGPLRDAAWALAGREDLGAALRALDVALSMEAAALGLPLREAFAEVHRSNMTKEPGHRIGAAKYGPGGGKGPGYRPPDIESVLAAAGWPGAEPARRP